MSIRTSPQPTLSAAIIRRRPRPLLLAPPTAYSPYTPAPTADASRGWSDDLRFFVTCYAAGVVFFLIMLS